MQTLARWNLFSFILLSFLLGAALAQTRTDYSGAYAVAGTNPDGSSYTGTMNVSVYGDGYRVTAVYGSDTWSGIGNDIGDYLAVAFLDAGNPIISIYRVSGNNTLEGFWQSTTASKEGSEVATLAARNFSLVPSGRPPAVSYDYSGSYAISGKNPDGSAYSASMILSAFGDGYKVAYASGGDTWSGVASDFGNYLAIAFLAGKIPSVNIYELQKDGSMVGYWLDYDNQKEGQETIVKR